MRASSTRCSMKSLKRPPPSMPASGMSCSFTNWMRTRPRSASPYCHMTRNQGQWWRALLERMGLRSAPAPPLHSTSIHKRMATRHRQLAVQATDALLLLLVQLSKTRPTVHTSLTLYLMLTCASKQSSLGSVQQRTDKSRVTPSAAPAAADLKHHIVPTWLSCEKPSIRSCERRMVTTGCPL